MLYLVSICIWFFIRSSIMSYIGWKSIGLLEGVFLGGAKQNRTGRWPKKTPPWSIKENPSWSFKDMFLPCEIRLGVPISTGGGGFWHVGLREGLWDCSLSSFNWSFPKQPPQLSCPETMLYTATVHISSCSSFGEVQIDRHEFIKKWPELY